jgi:hypothetical protein
VAGGRSMGRVELHCVVALGLDLFLRCTCACPSPTGLPHCVSYPIIVVFAVPVQSGDTCVHLGAYQGSPTVMELLLGYDGEPFGARCINVRNEVSYCSDSCVWRGAGKGVVE